MPEPSSSTTAQQPVAPAITRFDAQLKLGLVAPLDYGAAALIAFVWMTLGFWKLFGNPSPMHLIALALVNIFLTQIWIIVLVYRGMVFILDQHADIGLMPEAAARIVIGYREGRMK